MSHTVKGVRILLIGDDGVGKTSLILSLVTEEFPDEVPARAEEITIPADVTPEKVPTHIVDFSNVEQTEDDLRDELELADVVCVVYACDNDESIGRITSFWLPIVFEVCGDNRQKPVVIVGNKSDLMENEGEKTDKLLAIMDEYPEVETCIECSAYDLKNISELFYYAQKAVLHPTAPLFSHDEQQLTEKCEDGLVRIFRICDLDNDGVLNDVELNEFQKRCFRNSLPPHGLQEVKNIIRRNMDDGVNEGGVTLLGFLYLHSLFIQKGRQETTWTALRRFGYDHNLQLREDYLIPNIQIGSDCSIELSSSGLDFIMELFYKYDADEDDALSPDELSDMISLCNENPWKDMDLTSTCSTDEGWMTAEGFVAQWVLWTFIDYRWTLKMLAQFGFIHGDLDNQLSALRITRSKAIDHQKRKTTRCVFLVYVVGPTGSGKTAFLQSFVNKKYNEEEAKEYSKFAINSVQTRKQEVYIVLEEISFEDAETKLLESKHDATVYLYDVSDSSSFTFVAELHNKVNLEKIPSVFVGSKIDKGTVKQDYDMQPNEFAIVHSPYPLQYYRSVPHTEDKFKTIFTKIATLCTHLGSSSTSENSVTRFALSCGLGLSIIAGVGFLLFRYVRQTRIVSTS